MRIPVKISPFFFLTAALIGWLSSAGMDHMFILTIIWVVVIFVSILVHEYGHALTARYFGQKPRIHLVAFGGITYPEGKRLRGWREFLVVLNGPLFGLILFVIALFLLSTNFFENPFALITLKIFAWVNLFWTLVNLLPVMPLDGGQLLRVIFESIFGAKGLKYAVGTSMILAAIFAVAAFFIGYFLIGAIFFLFAFQNFSGWKQSKVMTESDTSEELTTLMKEIEELINNGQKEAAIPKLEEVRKKAKAGVIFNLASQFLANIKGEKGEYKEVYDILKPIQKQLNPEGELQLHRAAFEVQDFPLVAELGGPAFQLLPDPQIALNNARASAALSQQEAAIGWLNAAKSAGMDSLKPVLEEKVFDPLRDTEEFKKLIEP